MCTYNVYVLFVAQIGLYYTFKFFKILEKTLFLERGEGREKEGEEKNQGERETLICCLSHMPQRGTKPATQACALTGN